MTTKDEALKQAREALVQQRVILSMGYLPLLENQRVAANCESALAAIDAALASANGFDRVTAAEFAALDAYIEAGTHKLAAKALGLSYNTICAHMASINAKTGLHGMKLAREYERWQQDAKEASELFVVGEPQS